MKGRRHRFQYKAKVNPQLEIEFKSTNKWTKHDKSLQRDLHAQQVYQNQSGPPVYFQPVNPWGNMGPTINYETTDDIYVLKKDEALRPTREQALITENLVLLTEKTLKSISDVFAEEEKKTEEKVAMETASEVSEAPPTTATASLEPERLLKGVMRVGLLSKNLLLNTDKEVQLVVLCSKVPTVELLKQISEYFPKHAVVKFLKINRNNNFYLFV